MSKPRDPKCEHKCAGRVSWPVDLNGTPNASTYVCDRSECIEDAARWVESITGTRGVFVAHRARPNEGANA